METARARRWRAAARAVATVVVWAGATVAVMAVETVVVRRGRGGGEVVEREVRRWWNGWWGMAVVMAGEKAVVMRW